MAILVALHRFSGQSGCVEWSPEHIAVEHEDLETLLALMAAGSDVDDPTPDGMTLLHHSIDVEAGAARQTGEPLSVEMTRFLVDWGADTGYRWLGETPIEAAEESGHSLAVEVLRKAENPLPDSD